MNGELERSAGPLPDLRQDLGVDVPGTDDRQVLRGVDPGTSASLHDQHAADAHEVYDLRVRRMTPSGSTASPLSRTRSPSASQGGLDGRRSMSR